MTKTILILAIASVLVAGAFAIIPAVYAPSVNSPANGGVPPGLPFQNLQAQIDEINDEIDTLVADTDDAIADIQAQIDALSDDVDANADDIAVLENILGTNCGFGAIRAISSTGVVFCISVDEAENVVMGRIFAPVVAVTSGNEPRTSIATCPLFLGRATGGGFDNTGFSIGSTHVGAKITENFAISTTSWLVQAIFPDAGHGQEHFRAVVSCLRVL